MAVIKKDFNIMALPLAIERANPIPLDSTTIWYSLSDMQEYAKSGATAYVGQTLVLVDETASTAVAYIISDTEGNLQEIGVGKITFDGVTIETSDDGKTGLKDFGKKYYKWVSTVPASGTPGEDGYTAEVPGHYEAQDVDIDHPWKAGLELRTVNGSEIGWYEQNTETAEGLNSAVAALQSDIDEIRTQVTSLASAFSFKGSLTLADGQTAEDALKTITDPRAGDVYQIGNDEWVYSTEQGWIELGPNVDLSNYATLDDVKVVEDKVDALTAVDGKITILENKVEELTKTDGTIDALTSRVGNLETLVGTKATDTTAATGIFADLEAVVTGAQLDGADLTVTNQKIQLSTFKGSTAGLVPVYTAAIEGEDQSKYMLDGTGTWSKPKDERIATTGDYDNINDWVNKQISNAVESATLVWYSIKK